MIDHNAYVLGFFLQNGLDLGHPVFKGTLPTLVARKDLKLEVISSLIDILLIGGLNINDTESESGSTALHIACATENEEMVKLLLEKGADINAVNCHR